MINMISTGFFDIMYVTLGFRICDASGGTSECFQEGNIRLVTDNNCKIYLFSKILTIF